MNGEEKARKVASPGEVRPLEALVRQSKYPNISYFIDSSSIYSSEFDLRLEYQAWMSPAWKKGTGASKPPDSIIEATVFGGKIATWLS